MKAILNLFDISYSKRFAALAAIVILAAGCGDDSDDGGATASASGSGGSGSGSGSGGGSGSTASLELSGEPPTQIVAGTSYSFTPTVSNPNDVTVTFTAVNLPDWASLDASTGEITGSPDAGDVGTYSNISLTAAGGGESDTTPAYSIAVVSVASGSASLTWTPPSEKTDGSALTDLEGYRIYYGQSQGNLNQTVEIDDPGITTYIVENLTPATWYFAATAYDSDGMESSFSNVASKDIM